jgi:hypothetical protein
LQDLLRATEGGGFCSDGGHGAGTMNERSFIVKWELKVA